MKKKIIGSVFVVAFALVAGYNVYRSQKSVEMSDIALANVEALAGGENGVDDGTCYNSITTKSGSKVRYCGNCQYVDNSEPATFSGTGKCGV